MKKVKIFIGGNEINESEFSKTLITPIDKGLEKQDGPCLPKPKRHKIKATKENLFEINIKIKFEIC